ncbi:MAG TPA: redox-sensing transcriptional repressor Rex [Chthoniobacterales bacterium]
MIPFAGALVDAVQTSRYFSHVTKVVIPQKTVYRLSLYFRIVERLHQNRIETVSSAALAKAAGVKPTQLRKDLTYFGQFGTRGLGYKVESLVTQLASVLRTARFQPVILVGAGNLGSALMHYDGFAKEGFEIIAAFDIRPERAKSGNPNIPILPMDRLKGFISEHSVKLAILTVPGTNAQVVTNELVEAGIQAILNFSPSILQVPNNVVVNNVNLAIELENLSYFIT